MSERDNVIYVGKKPTMVYVLAALTQFTKGAEEVYIRARGNAISRAVSVAQVLRDRYMPELKVKDIKISTEELASEDGKVNRVSAIEIILSK